MDQETVIPPTKDDVLAILKAHRDLGPEFDQHLADQILDLWNRGKPAEKKPESRPERRREFTERNPRRGGMGHAIPYFALSIPLLAIAGVIAKEPGVFGVPGLDAIILLASIFSR